MKWNISVIKVKKIIKDFLSSGERTKNRSVVVLILKNKKLFCIELLIAKQVIARKVGLVILKRGPTLYSK